MRTRGLAAVVGEVSRLGLTASRCLQLAAERTGVVALVIRRRRTGADREAGEGEPTVALTRWQVSPQPGTGPPSPACPGSAGSSSSPVPVARTPPAPRSWTRLMRRVVFVHLSTWSTDLWPRRNASRAPAWDNPLFVAESDGPRRGLVAVDREDGDTAFPLPQGRSDEARGGRRDQREPAPIERADRDTHSLAAAPASNPAIEVATRNFR